jgi:hypothetical protein
MLLVNPPAFSRGLKRWLQQLGLFDPCDEDHRLAALVIPARAKLGDYFS